MASRKARRGSRGVAPHHGVVGGAGWLSGASSVGTGDVAGGGVFGTWRGSTVPFFEVWIDADAATAMAAWPLDSGAEYDTWTGSGEFAIGGIWIPAGDTWAAAAAGSYDSRWTTILTALHTGWTNKTRGTCYIRPFHEWNGNWMPWSVTSGDIANFITAWRRLYNLKQSIFPTAKLVWCTNSNTAGQSYDFRTAWPGDGYVDVYSTDWYSNAWVLFPTGNEVDTYGAPEGLNQHLAFAALHGKPMGISEWADDNAQNGDVPNYIQYIHDFCAANGNSTPTAGKLLYECYFNEIWTPNNWALYPENQTLSPNAAVRYKTVFAGSVSAGQVTAVRGTATTAARTPTVTGGGGGGSWPTSAIAVYNMMWSNSPGTPSGTPAGVNIHLLAFAQGSTSLSLVGYSPEGRTSLLSTLATWRGRGDKIIISLAGAGAPVMTFGSNTANMVTSLDAIATDLGGIDGIDWDVEDGTLTQTDCTGFSQACRNHFGANFMVTMAPNGTVATAQVPMAKALSDAGLLYYTGQQFYETPVTQAAADGRVTQLISAGVPATKIAIGMMVGSDTNLYWPETTCVTNMTYFKNTRSVTKCYLWEESIDSAAWVPNMRGVLGI